MCWHGAPQSTRVFLVTFGGILGGAWELYTKFFKRFFVIALIVFGIVNLLNALVATLFGSGAGIAALLALITDVSSARSGFRVRSSTRSTTCATAGWTRRSGRSSSAFGRTCGR